ncbi:multiple inositol polyphosphate phosphatase 1-like [Oculina patagonica]
MDLKMAVSILFYAFIGCFVQGSQQLESSFSEKTRLKFASKTPYQKRNISFETPKNCESLHISMVLRHGTRYPSRKDVGKIDKMLKVVNEAFNSSTQKRIGDLRFPWKNPFSRTHDKLLAPVGEQEMYEIAKEMLKRFPSLLSRPYHPQDFDFISTGTSRASQSAMAFAYGLFEGRGQLGLSLFQPVAVQSRAIDNDPLLRFFDLCPKYSTEVAENETALLEYKKFKHGEEMKNVFQKVLNKMGIHSSAFSDDNIVAMYTACIFEVAIFGRENTWCQLFDDEDSLVLEYLFDLKHYWKRGYGYPITYKISCHLLEKIVSTLKNATDSTSEEKKYGTFMFAHGETLQPLYALLGLFKDREDLRADNFLKQLERKYKTGNIVPFGANIAFVMYKCTESLDPHSFIVQAFVNEELVALPCCGEQTECPWETFLQCFDSKPNGSCNLSSLCSLDSSNPKQSHVEL